MQLEKGQPGEITITVIDNSDAAGKAASRMWGDWGTRIYVTSNPADMVTKVLGTLRATNSKLKRLNIFDHGTKSRWFQQGSNRRMQIGVKVFGLQSFEKPGNRRLVDGELQYGPSIKTTLQQLKGHFAPGASLHLYHCWIGANTQLLQSISAAVGVPVSAGTGPTEAWFGTNVGCFNTAMPDGSISSSFNRP